MAKFLFILNLVSAASLAEVFFVQRVIRVGGISSDEATAITSLISTSVTENGHQVTSQVSDSSFVLESRLVKLGNSLTLSIDKKKGEKIFYSSKMKANSIEELDEIVSRLVKAVISEEDPFEEAEVGKISRAEALQGNLRKASTGASYVAFGPAALKQLNNTNIGVYAAAAWVWDVNQAIVRLAGHFAISGGALFTNVGLGANYFLSEKSFAPFIGGELGYGIARLNRGSLLNSETVNGFVLTPQIGANLFRTTDINLELAVFGSFMMKKGSLGRPVLYGLRVGLYY